MNPELEAWNEELLAAAKPVKVLRAFVWPSTLRPAFLEAWRAGNPRLPQPPPPRVQDLDASLARLARLAEREADDPASAFLQRTARSYLTAALMLQASGTSDFTRHSVELYGAPSQTVAPNGMTNLEAAERFTAATERWTECPDDTQELSAVEVAAALQRRASTLVAEHPLTVSLDPSLAAKCAAGADEIRLRAGTSFRKTEVAQLVRHELEVHTASSVNGSLQPLSVLSLGAPRTTAHQEGLATFAELITGTIDIGRLRRVSLRVKAIDLALRGADFVEVFEFFVESGQSEDESFHSSARIFRGGDVRGGSIFTKDAVYLRGLFEVHSFFNAAFEEGRIELIDHFFSGRMTCADAVELQPLYTASILRGPRYLPRWARNKPQLAAYLAFSSLTHAVDMGSLSLSDLAQREVSVPSWLEPEVEEEGAMRERA